MDHVICSYLGELCSIVGALRNDLMNINYTLNEINDKLDNIETGATDLIENISDSVDMLSEKMNNICNSFGEKIGIDPEHISEEEVETYDKESKENEAVECKTDNLVDISINIGDIDTEDIDIGSDEGFVELARRLKNRFIKK